MSLAFPGPLPKQGVSTWQLQAVIHLWGHASSSSLPATIPGSVSLSEWKLYGPSAVPSPPPSPPPVPPAPPNQPLPPRQSECQAYGPES